MTLLRWTWQAIGDERSPDVLLDSPVVWQVDLDAADPAGDTLLVALLQPDERARLDGLHFEIDQRRYLRAHGALRLLLSRYCGVQPDEIVLERGHCGKPYLVNGARRLQFNLAHSRDRMLLGLHTAGPIGVDLELVDREVDFRALFRYVLTPSESTYLDAQPRDRQRTCFYRFWVAKEALLKATGDGLARPMTEIEIDLSGTAPEIVRLPDSFAPHLRLEAWTADGFAAAVAVAEDEDVRTRM